MRNRITIATVALLMLVPVNAFAQDADFCYENPTDPSCDGVENQVEQQPEGEPDANVEGEVEVEGVSVEVLDTADEAELAETGISATLFSVIAALMLAAGALLLVVSRRRDSTV